MPAVNCTVPALSKGTSIVEVLGASTVKVPEFTNSGAVVCDVLAIDTSSPRFTVPGLVSSEPSPSEKEVLLEKVRAPSLVIERPSRSAKEPYGAAAVSEPLEAIVVSPPPVWAPPVQSHVPLTVRLPGPNRVPPSWTTAPVTWDPLPSR